MPVFKLTQSEKNLLRYAELLCKQTRGSVAMIENDGRASPIHLVIATSLRVCVRDHTDRQGEQRLHTHTPYTLRLAYLHTRASRSPSRCSGVQSSPLQQITQACTRRQSERQLAMKTWPAVAYPPDLFVRACVFVFVHLAPLILSICLHAIWSGCWSVWT